jgi:hypothetical protein
MQSLKYNKNIELFAFVHSDKYSLAASYYSQQAGTGYLKRYVYKEAQ